MSREIFKLLIKNNEFSEEMRIDTYKVFSKWCALQNKTCNTENKCQNFGLIKYISFNGSFIAHEVNFDNCTYTHRTK